MSDSHTDFNPDAKCAQLDTGAFAAVTRDEKLVHRNEIQRLSPMPN